MRRSERQGDLMWGAMGLGMGLLAGFVLAEVVGGRAALGQSRSETGLPGEQEGATPVDEPPLPFGDLQLADQSA